MTGHWFVAYPELINLSSILIPMLFFPAKYPHMMVEFCGPSIELCLFHKCIIVPSYIYMYVCVCYVCCLFCVCLRTWLCARWLIDEEICDGRGPRPVVTSDEIFSEVAGSCWSLHNPSEVSLS